MPIAFLPDTAPDALLVAWQAGTEVYLPPNLAADNRRWDEQHAVLWFTDQADFPHPICLYYHDALSQATESAGGSGSFLVPDEAELYLKTSGLLGVAK